MIRLHVSPRRSLTCGEVPRGHLQYISKTKGFLQLYSDLLTSHAHRDMGYGDEHVEIYCKTLTEQGTGSCMEWGPKGHF